MAGIPALSSLPGASRTIFLDFDGDFQSVWNRTDSNQRYTNVTAGEFNIDGTAGISDAEEAAIRKIWETVADDYAPFKVNVTTVAPSSFANGVALRVVMAGDCNATLQISATSSINVSGDRFIANPDGTLVDTSGYSSVGSFTNFQPNVVYVFAKYMSTWGLVDSEGHSRDLRAMIATTASHEAGHAFGLVHDGDYSVGSAITTPIMGANTQGDRTIWSTYYVGATKHDNVAKLTGVFGARTDDYVGTYNTAKELQFTSYSPLFGSAANVKGVIGRTTDTDMFRLTVYSAKTYDFNVSVPQFGNLDSQLILYRVTATPAGTYWYQTVASADPSISWITPFQGLGASFSATLQPGYYAIAVKSHGGYGDLGSYTLRVSHSSIIVTPDPPLMALSMGGVGQTLTSQASVVSDSTAAVQPLGNAGIGNSLPLAAPLIAKSPLPAGETPLNLPAPAVDAVFESWGIEGTKLRRKWLDGLIGSI
jgi:hypothetical protein